MKFFSLFILCLSLVQLVYAQEPTKASSSTAYAHATNWESNGNQVKKIDLTIKEHKIELVPKVPTNLWMFGSSKKAPVFRVKQGDKLQIRISNQLTQATSMHWHGLRVPNAMDGVPKVTQPVISPGKSFTYEFVTNDVGTFWFHPHEGTSEQLGRGLYAIIIVEEKTPPVYDQDWVMALKDYRLEGKGVLAKEFGNLHDATHGGRYGNFVTINNVTNPKYKVALGDRVRMRLVNVSNARPYELDFSNWKAKVIAHDGGYVEKPYSVDILTITPGERFELEIIFNDPEKRGKPLKMLTSRSAHQLAQVSYSEQNHPETIAQLPKGKFPHWDHLKKIAPEHTIDLGGINVMGGTKRVQGQPPSWTINDGAYPDTHKAISFKLGKLTKIRITNKSYQPHPMHMHGDFFQILSINGVAPITRSWKDTINLPGQSYAEIAMVPTNPGTWAFHCHILEHAETGMMTTFVVQ